MQSHSLDDSRVTSLEFQAVCHLEPKPYPGCRLPAVRNIYYVMIFWGWGSESHKTPAPHGKEARSTRLSQKRRDEKTALHTGAESLVHLQTSFGNSRNPGTRWSARKRAPSMLHAYVGFFRAKSRLASLSLRLLKPDTLNFINLRNLQWDSASFRFRV